MQTVNLAARQGATMVRNTVVELSDGMLVNFIYEVTGLGSFATEVKKARKLKFRGCEIPVMPLNPFEEQSRGDARQRPAQIHAIDETLRLRKKAMNRCRKSKSKS